MSPALLFALQTVLAWPITPWPRPFATPTPAATATAPATAALTITATVFVADTAKRKRPSLVQYSDLYATRLAIHRALSYAMIPLFIGSAVTGFELRNKREQAPQWARDLHGPLAAGTAVVFGMNTVTGLWNLVEGRRDPVGRGKRLLHGALLLAAGAGLTYVTVAGDDIRATGRPNHWHRDIALGSMVVAVTGWGMMAFGH